MNRKTKIVILGIDNFSPKNSYQLRSCNELGFQVEVFTNDRQNNSKENIFDPHNLNVLKKHTFSRLFQIIHFFIKNYFFIHHVEIYPGGRFAYIYLFLIKIFCLKSITVERGELVFWKQRSLTQKFFLKALYKKTDMVWYKEIYMKKILNHMKISKMYFLHNCCTLPVNHKNEQKEIDFLWVNRLMIERKIEWVLDYLPKKENIQTLIIGNKNNDERVEKYFKNSPVSNLKIKGFISPHNYYPIARFFLLPSDIVFANNALLEAMSYGVVPLVSDVSGSDLIVDHLQSGYIFPHNYQGFKQAIEWAIKLDKASYDKLSQNAILKVEKDFSFEKFKVGYKKMIDSI